LKIIEDWSQGKIADGLNIFQYGIQNIIMKFSEHDSIENLPKRVAQR